MHLKHTLTLLTALLLAPLISLLAAGKKSPEARLQRLFKAYPEADVLVAETKSDLGEGTGKGRMRVSSVTGEGLVELRKELLRRLPKQDIEWLIREG